LLPPTFSGPFTSPLPFDCTQSVEAEALPTVTKNASVSTTHAKASRFIEIPPIARLARRLMALAWAIPGPPMTHPAHRRAETPTQATPLEAFDLRATYSPAGRIDRRCRGCAGSPSSPE
jgi:hypothetical protein